MSDRISRLAACAIALTVSVAVTSSVASAQASPQYYSPPKLVKQGSASSVAAGRGTVVVQVLVNPDGTFKVQKIVRSSNPADNAAAMEIAGSSTYKPATRGKTKVVAFYTYTLKFAGSGATTSDAASGGQLAQYTAQIKAANYAGAKAGLTAYLDAHPGDAQAASLLGVADTFLDDYTGAAAAFDKAGGQVPAQYKIVQARAYAGAAEKAITAKDGTAAVAFAKRANELAPAVATLNLLGNAQLAAGDPASATASFERARAESTNNPKVDTKQRAVIAANLASAYVASGQPEKATAMLADIKTLDPSNTVAEAAVVGFYQKKAQATTGADAAALYEKAALVGSTYAVSMYINEAFAYVAAAKPDYKAAKVAADKALALKADDGNANFIAGIALANDGKPKEALPFLQKADVAAKASGDKVLGDKVTTALKQLSPAK